MFHAFLSKNAISETLMSYICDCVRENQPYVGKNVLRFSTDITKVPPDGPSLVDCLLPAQDIATFICTNKTKWRLLVGITNVSVYAVCYT